MMSGYLTYFQGTPARWRDFHSATGIGDNMYIFGGRSDRAGPFHTSHEMYCNAIQVGNGIMQVIKKFMDTVASLRSGHAFQVASFWYNMYN